MIPTNSPPPTSLARLAAFLRGAGLGLARVFGLREVAVCAGFACLAGGAWWIYPPAGLLVAGAVLLTLGLFGVPSWDS